MNGQKKTFLTINLLAEDHHRSNNQNSNDRSIIDSTPLYILYPDFIGSKESPTVPPCHKQEMLIDGILIDK